MSRENLVRKPLATISKRHRYRIIKTYEQRFVSALTVPEEAEPSALQPSNVSESLTENIHHSSDSTSNESETESSTDSDQSYNTIFCDRTNTSGSDNPDSSESDENELPSGSDDSCSTSANSFINLLTQWALSFKISHSALSALLKILQPFHPFLPSDARTFLKTPRVTPVTELPPGHYWHSGLAHGFQQMLSGLDLPEIHYSINVDGLPLSHSSGSSLWPILCLVEGSGIFLVGAYHGYQKPDDANSFLEPFVTEASDLESNGILLNGKIVKVCFRALICDAPAKSFVLNTKAHNAFFGCSKCITGGDFVDRRVTYPQINAPRRTDDGFKSQLENEEHHKGPTILTTIPNFGPVTNVVLDYMHLICLGVMKKLLTLWMSGKHNVRLCSRQINDINSKLTSLSAFIPREFVRKPRSLRFFKHWKATEFRQMLLYTGPLVLKNVLPTTHYEHFLCLHVAVTILCRPDYSADTELRMYANDLLQYFVKTFASIYGCEQISHNVHNLVHIADDVRKFGPLDSFSAFPYENHMQQLKKLIRKSDKPLQQLARRYKENESAAKGSVKSDFSEPKCSGHSNGILLSTCKNAQYKSIKFSKFALGLTEANNCCLLDDGSIVVTENIAHSVIDNNIVIVGRAFEKKTNLYSHPWPSANLGIYIVKKQSGLRTWNLSQIKGKFVRLSTESNSSQYVVIPLLHLEA